MSVKPLIVFDSRLVCSMAVIGAAVMLKIFYRSAGSEQLVWIIGPIAFLIELFTDFSFVREAGFGWVDFDHHIVIAPPCAGVNFLIITFCMSSFLMLGRGNSLCRVITIIVIAGLASYVATVIACCARILVSLYVYRLDIYSGWLTSDTVHRVVGVCIYYLFLSFYFHLAYHFSSLKGQVDRATDGAGSLTRKRLVFLIPLFWYLIFSLGVPLMNGAYSTNRDLFLSHALGVASVSMLLTVIMLTVHSLVTVLKKTCRT